MPWRWNAPITDVANWPRLVQLAWIVYDTEKHIISKRNAIIRPEGYTIPVEAARIHGITTQVALEKGESLQEVLEEFSAEIDKAQVLVGHNISCLLYTSDIRTKCSLPEFVGILLNFVQTSFDYQTDEEQFGREKYFYPEEILAYPFCDCEDRAAFFARLVRNLTGLEVVGLDYPGPVSYTHLIGFVGLLLWVC